VRVLIDRITGVVLVRFGLYLNLARVVTNLVVAPPTSHDGRYPTRDARGFEHQPVRSTRSCTSAALLG